MGRFGSSKFFGKAIGIALLVILTTGVANAQTVAPGGTCATDAECVFGKCVAPATGKVCDPAAAPAAGSVDDGDPCTDKVQCKTGGAQCASPATGGTGSKVCIPPTPAAPAMTAAQCIAFCKGGGGSFGACICTAPAAGAKPAWFGQPWSDKLAQTICEDHPLSDPTAATPEERRAGCVWTAQAQAGLLGRKVQFWHDVAWKAWQKSQRITEVNAYWAETVALVAEKSGNRFSGHLADRTALAEFVANVKALAGHLGGTPSWGDLNKLGLGTVTLGSRSVKRKQPTCPAGYTFSRTVRNRAYGSATGNWICERGGIRTEPTYTK